MQFDKHVKMPLESAQLLCSVFPAGKAPYKRTNYNHSCSIWVRSSKENFNWLVKHGMALCKEFTFRFVICFDQKYKIGNAVDSYREYYRSEKRKIAKWNKNRNKPKWF